MGRMNFNIIPRDGKSGVWQGDAAKYDSSSAGRYEMYITDYADDVCDGETQTAKRAYLENADALLALLMSLPELELKETDALCNIKKIMSESISNMDEFTDLCGLVGVTVEEMPLLIERFDT